VAVVVGDILLLEQVALVVVAQEIQVQIHQLELLEQLILVVVVVVVMVDQVLAAVQA
jgi:hypothetical protein